MLTVRGQELGGGEHSAPCCCSELHAAAPLLYCVAAPQVVYTTACCASGPTGDGSMVPLTVNYQERFSAAGKTRYVLV